MRESTVRCICKKNFVLLKSAIFRELIEEIAKFEEREFSAKKTVSQVFVVHVECVNCMEMNRR